MPPPVGDHASGIAERDDVLQRLASLPRKQRVVLVLRFYEQLNDAEIAGMLGCSVGTVRSNASRALATLRMPQPTDDQAPPAEPGRLVLTRSTPPTTETTT